jgi:hypothetical protein
VRRVLACAHHRRTRHASVSEMRPLCHLAHNSWSFLICDDTYACLHHFRTTPSAPNDASLTQRLDSVATEVDYRSVNRTNCTAGRCKLRELMSARDRVAKIGLKWDVDIPRRQCHRFLGDAVSLSLACSGAQTFASCVDGTGRASRCSDVHRSKREGTCSTSGDRPRDECLFVARWL